MIKSIVNLGANTSMCFQKGKENKGIKEYRSGSHLGLDTGKYALIQVPVGVHHVLDPFTSLLLMIVPSFIKSEGGKYDDQFISSHPRCERFSSV